MVTDTIEMHAEAKKQGVPWFPVTCYAKEFAPFTVFPPVLKIPTSSVYKNSNAYIPNFLSVVEHLKKNKINLIVSNTPASMGFLAMASASFLKIPWVDIYHTDVEFYMNVLLKGVLKPLKNMTALSFLKLYHKKADLIFVRNRDHRDSMIKKGHPEKKIEYYPAGVDQERFHPRFKDRSVWKKFAIDPKKRVVIFVGRITKVKDIIFLLDHFADSQDPSSVLALIGEGPEYEVYHEKYASKDNIYFLGVQRGETLQKIYASADLSVLPSSSETLGKTILESMASGTAVLTSDKGGPKDYVQEPVNGKIFQAGSYESFREVLSELLSGGYDLEKMGRSAHKAVKAYTMESLFKNFLSSIQVLL